MFVALFASLACLPALVLGLVAVAARWIRGPRAPALQAALWLSTLAALLYAAWQSLSFYRDAAQRNLVVGSVVFIAMPLFATAVALLVFGYAWGLGALGVEATRLAHGTTRPLAAAARCLLPVGALLIAVFFTYDVLRPSAYDRVKRVRSAEALEPLYKKALRDNDGIMLQTLANSPLLPVDRLSALADHADPWVRCRVAANARTPADVLNRLADDVAPEVRLSLASNEAAPEAALRRLAARSDDSGRAADNALRIRRAATQPSTTPT